MNYQRLCFQIERFDLLKNLSESDLYDRFLPALRQATYHKFPPTFTLAHRDLWWTLKLNAVTVPAAASSLILSKSEEEKKDYP